MILLTILTAEFIACFVLWSLLKVSSTSNHRYLCMVNPGFMILPPVPERDDSCIQSSSRSLSDEGIDLAIETQRLQIEQLMRLNPRLLEDKPITFRGIQPKVKL